MTDRPELLDYVVFFETEPKWVSPEGWYYGARFVTQRGDDRIVAFVAPDEAELSVEWWQADLLRVRLNAVMATQWETEVSPARELLRVSFNDELVKACELQLKPHVRVDWRMSWA